MHSYRFYLFPAILLVLSISLFAGVAEDRETAKQELKKGNWKNAYELREKLLKSTSDGESDEDLREARTCMDNLREFSKTDDLLVIVKEKHKDNWKVLTEAALMMEYARTVGLMIDNKYHRGLNWSQGARQVDTFKRDRVITLQLYWDAYKKAPEKSKKEVLQKLQRYLWKYRHALSFFELTDLSVIPEMENRYYHYRFHSVRYAPEGEDGGPMFIYVPNSYEEAKSDGERWRWVISELGKSGVRSKELANWAHFLREQYGVRSLASFSWWGRYSSQSENTKTNKEGILSVHNLTDEQTVCRIATGVRRIDLEDEFNYLKILRKLYENHNDQSAGDTLVDIYLDRRQYTKAATLLARIIEKNGDGHMGKRKQKYEQIVGDWGSFTLGDNNYLTNEGIDFELKYRNAKSVDISLFEVDFDGVTNSLWARWKSNPKTLDYKDRSWNYRLVEELLSGKYNLHIGEKIHTSTFDLTPRDGYIDTLANLSIPAQRTAGCYLLKGEIGEGKSRRLFYKLIWVNQMVVTTTPVHNGTLYYVADAKTGKPLKDVTIQLRGFEQFYLKTNVNGRRYNIRTKEKTGKTNKQGFVVLNAKEHYRYQWMTTATYGESKAWIGVMHMRGGDSLAKSNRPAVAFGITSQPVYRPGNKVDGKIWIRETDYSSTQDAPEYERSSVNVTIYDPKGKKYGDVLKLTTDIYGGVSYTIDLPKDVLLGRYRVMVDARYAGYFKVEKYKKPEFEVIVDAPKEPVLLGDKIEAKVTAKYYHGAPVTNGKVKVKVLRNSYTSRWFPSFRWDWLYGNGYGWLDIERRWSPWYGVWACKCPYPFWYRSYDRSELVSEEWLDLKEDGTVKVNIDSSIAKLIHGDKDHRYEISVEVTDASRRTIYSKGSVIAARKPFQVTTWLNKGYAKTGEMIEVSTVAKTLAGKNVKGEGAFILKRVTLGEDGKFVEKEIKQWELKESVDGFEKLAFSCEDPGQYSMVVEVTDAKGRKESGGLLFEVRGPEGKAAGVAYNDIELIVDKREYGPGETVNLLVNTKEKEAHVLLFIRNTLEMKLIKIENHSATIDIPLSRKDIPNISVHAMTVANGKVYKEDREIIIPPVEKVLNVEVIADAKKYKPQAKGSVKVRVTDHEGKPVQGSAVVAIYDKSLEYISGGSNVPKIKPFFWKKEHSYRRYWVDSILAYGYPALKAKHVGMQSLGAFGNSLARGGLGEKTDSISKEAGSVQSAPTISGELDKSIGSSSVGSFGRDKRKNSFLGKDNANIEVGKNGGANQIEEQIHVRKDFADMAKWVGALELDENGEASIPVTFPDNLTTWKVKAWTMSHGTRVGEGSTEVITSKDLLIRLQAPRFFIEKDEVTLSAVVHNYHDEVQDATVSIELEGGHLKLLTDNEKKVKLEGGNGEERIDWTVKVSGEGEATVRMKVLTANDGDVMEVKFPVYVHGIQKQIASSGSAGVGDESIKFMIDVPEERKPELSKLEIRYSPSLAMAIVDALPYLVEYPHGCTEQTLNRFVPTVITQKLLKDLGINLVDVKNKRTNLNAQELGDDKIRAKQWKSWKRNPVFDEAEVNKMVSKGVKRLTDMQLNDGGWGWFSGYGEKSYPHTTAVVVHGLLLAKSNGAKVSDDVIRRGVQWLKNYEARELREIKLYQTSDGKKGKKDASYNDAVVRLTLAENKISNQSMLDEIYAVKNESSLYVKCMLAMSLHYAKDTKRLAVVMDNLEQFMVKDDENQTAYLKTQNSHYWWYWYGDDIETHAMYLKLLTLTKPKSETTRGVVKYLLNNRKNGTYWKSTRDTAYCIEAIAAYVKASDEDKADMVVEVLVNGEVKKEVTINGDNLFTYDNKFILEGDEVTSGEHKIELRKKGKGALYANAYLSVFTKEDHIKKTGAEVKVERRYYKLVKKEGVTKKQNAKGRLVDQKVDLDERILLKDGDLLKSGDRIEVELIIESKNDYEYLMVSDWKAAGLEAERVNSGYIWGGFRAYMEVHDERISYFIKNLRRGKHSVSYKLRAEIPGKFSALPAQIEAMYAPELKANSDEMKLKVED